MKKIQVLDCTLRDGGYVNDWRFGQQAITRVCDAVEQTGVPITELGFFRNETFLPGRTIFNSSESVNGIIQRKKENQIYTAMIEMGNYFPLEMLSNRTPGGLDAIRYVFWKRCMDETYEYSARIREKGYLLCFQPTRVEQYSDEEFAQMCRRFSSLDPYAVYIVDTFGLLGKDDLIRYAHIGNESLASGIILGYHAHDNMGQAFSNSCAFLEQDFGDRVLQIDATIGGMGRGSGNLRLEMLLEYLNRCHGANYNLSPIYKVWDDEIAKIKKKHPWEWDLAHFIVAMNACNPNYADYFVNHGMSVIEIEAAVSRISGADKYLYSDERAKRYANR